jgi:CoA:oxalate CoA-transferase
MTSKTPMLTGYRVLDIAQVVAGPTCTRILAELGAEVIKIELAPHGDRTRAGGIRPRQSPFERSSQSTYFYQHNHSKKSVALDFKRAESIELIKSMVRNVDVLVENFAPGVMARAGLDYETLKAINPRLVMCSISLAGQSGPLKSKPGYDYIGQAYAGITDLIGEPDGDPALITMAIGDCATGITAAMAVGFALLHRERTGEGQYVEASLLDTYFQMHERNVPRVSMLGPDFNPTRTGSQHPDGGPTGIFRHPDGTFITLAVLPHQWDQFVRALELPELATDPKFATARLRRENDAQLKAIVEGWLARFPSRDEALVALDRERIPSAPVLTLSEAIAHPHLRERGTVRRVHDDHLGDFDIPGFPAKFSQWTEPKDLRAPLLGEHNSEVLHELVGLSEEQISALYSKGILVQDPLVAYTNQPS